MSVLAQATTLARAFHASVRAHADESALRAHGGAISWTWDDYRAHVCAAAGGLAGRHTWPHADVLAQPELSGAPDPGRRLTPGRPNSSTRSPSYPLMSSP